MFWQRLSSTALGISLIWASLGTVFAKQETSALASFVTHELTIQAADDHFITPSAVAPGLTLISFENIGTESRHSIFIRLPGGRTLDELLAPPSDPELPPDWVFEGTFTGFPGEAEPGQTTTALVNLEPGLYMLVDDFTSVLLVDPALASEATPTPMDIPADGAVDMHDFGFTFPETVAAGPQVWQIVNSGPQVHELMLIKSEVADITAEQALDAFMSETGETEGLSMEQLVPIGGLGWLSPGATAWIELDLEPGTYVAICWVFDPAAMMPHAMEGMIQVFTVE